MFITKRTTNLLDPFLSLDQFIDSFFYDWPQSDTKPPMAVRPIYEEKTIGKFDGDYSKVPKNLIGAQVEVAAAGYKEEDLRVWLEGDKLYISGDNTKRDLADRFRASFEKRVVLQKNLDTSKVQIKFEDGILSVYVPLKEVAQEKRLLFGAR